MYDAALGLAVLVLGMSVAMAAAWVLGTRTGQAGWADAIWSFSVGAAGLAAALAPLGGGQGPWARQAIVALLAGLWSLRLGWHIVARTIGAREDPRYAQFRHEWGAEFPRRFFWFLQIEAAAALPLIAAIGVAARNPAPFPRVADCLGIVLWSIAVVGEAVADRQVTAFRAEPQNRGKICDTGLWSLSRHPNYFFEWLGWCAYPLFAIDFSQLYVWGWLALIAPLLMYWLLVHVSGLPPLEAHMRRSRGRSFADYEARVSAFWPWPQVKKLRR